MGYATLNRDVLIVAQLEALGQYEPVDAQGKNTEGKHWWFIRRALADGRTLYLYPCGSGVSLGLSDPGDDCGYRDVYDFFDQPFCGWLAGFNWDGEGEPIGWNRAHRLGHHTRRRRGGFGEEYVDEADIARAPHLPRWP